MGVQRSMPPWLVALLVVVPCRAFPRVSRLTNEEIHQQVEKKGWAKTRVDKPEECDRDKCPKMMDICPEGGHCYVTGDCGDDGCLCNIKIQCKEKNKNESENQKETTGNQKDTSGNENGSENQETAGNHTETSGNEFQPEVGSDYSDDGDYDHEKEKGHNNLKHISCLKNIHNESYCQGWKKATCEAKNRQECCGQAEWSRDWKSNCGSKLGNCEDYEIPQNDSCCWRLTCPSKKEGHDYMESSNEKPHRYERGQDENGDDKVWDVEDEEYNEEEEEEEEGDEDEEEEEVDEGNGDQKEDDEENNNGENDTGYQKENGNNKDGNSDSQNEGDDKDEGEGDDEDESEGDDEEESEEVEESM